MSGNLPYFIFFLSCQEKSKSNWLFHALRKQVFYFDFSSKNGKIKKVVLKNVLWALIRGTRAQNFNYGYCDLPKSGLQEIFTISAKTSWAESDKILV